MSDVHVLAIDLAKRSFQVCATDRGGACVDAPVLQGYSVDGFCKRALQSVVCQAFDRGFPPRGRYEIRGTGSRSVQRALLLEPRDWFSPS